MLPRGQGGEQVTPSASGQRVRSLGPGSAGHEGCRWAAAACGSHLDKAVFKKGKVLLILKRPPPRNS